jgi:hypothetical protein
VVTVMPEPPDYDFRDETPTVEIPPPSRVRSGHLWLLAVAILGMLGVAYLFVRDRATPPPPQRDSPARAATAPARTALGGDAANITLPRLDDSDPVVAAMARQLTSDPLLASWLATGGLIRNVTVVIANIAGGTSPAVHLRAFRPTRPFTTIERGGMRYIDPRSYERYTPIARAIASIDPSAMANAYATFKPLIEEAYRDLGSDTPFDRTLERALVHLLSTPVVTDPVPVVSKGAGYAFANGSLEGLSAAQKQLLRFGPQNAASIQDALRNLALALGIPPERLP